MFDAIAHHFELKKLLRERRKTDAFYQDEYDKATTGDEEDAVAAGQAQEVGLIDDKIGLLLSQFYRSKADGLQIPTPPFSQTSGKWVEGEYTGKWRLSPEQVHKLRAAVRKDEKERWDVWQTRLTLLIGFGGMLIGLVSVLKR
jgi:hypothetical protein